jgi:hypothetical protein
LRAVWRALVVGFTYKQAVQGFRVEGNLPLAALDPESLDAALATVGSPWLFLDLRNAPKTGPVSDWLAKQRKIRMNDRYGELKPLDAFDALIFVDTVSSARDKG